MTHVASKTLKAATRFLFLVVFSGQLVFAFTVAAFYGGAAVRGHVQSWNQHMKVGYVPGDSMGNLAVGIHLISAVLIIFSGMLQLIPQVRDRAPAFHRWNGRVYFVTAFSVSLAGLYMMWVRGGGADLSQNIGTTLMAVLIMFCAVMAMRYAIARNFRTHRRWALRLYLVVSASLFIRAGVFLSLLINHGPFGFDPSTFTGPFLTFMTFAQYLVPLAILEIYLRIQDGRGVTGRFAMAGSLVIVALGLGAGVFAVTMVVWRPMVRKTFDSRISVAETLSTTIASRGIDEATRQYHQLKTADPATYDFDKSDLNALGYDLIHQKKLPEAIRIFQLNVEAFPQSGNAFDSLGEAYLDAGNKPLAIASYRQALKLNPQNANAAKVLQKLKGAQ